MLDKMKTRGPSTLRNQSTGGKRKTRKHRKKYKKKTRKNKNKNKKKTRKHKKRTKRGGMQMGEPVGNSTLKKIKQDGKFYVIKIGPSGQPIRDTNRYINENINFFSLNILPLLAASSPNCGDKKLVRFLF